jgi:hypothetical protein
VFYLTFKQKEEKRLQKSVDYTINQSDRKASYASRVSISMQSAQLLGQKFAEG